MRKKATISIETERLLILRRSGRVVDRWCDRCLAEVQNEGGPAMAAALQRYARERRPRVARVQRMAKRNAAIYHLSGPAAFARDLAMKAIGARRLLARQNWIYDWRV